MEKNPSACTPYALADGITVRNVSLSISSFSVLFSEKEEEEGEKKKIHQNQCEITHHPRVRQEATVQGHAILGAGITEQRMILSRFLRSIKPTKSLNQ